MGISEAEFRQLQTNLQTAAGAAVAKPAAVRPLYRSKAEATYASRLDARQRVGEIRRWRYEAVTLKLGPDCRYTPDFLIVPWEWPLLPLELHEVKGKHAWDDALVKLRAAAGAFPEFRFFLMRLLGTTWHEREVRAA